MVLGGDSGRSRNMIHDRYPPRAADSRANKGVTRRSPVVMVDKPPSWDPCFPASTHARRRTLPVLKPTKYLSGFSGHVIAGVHRQRFRALIQKKSRSRRRHVSVIFSDSRRMLDGGRSGLPPVALRAP